MIAQLEANLRALWGRDPALARSVRAARSDPRIGILRARSGRLVPVVDADGRRVAMHSQVDPEREAARVLAGLSDAGCIVFLGLGGGYEVAAALASGSLFSALVIERDATALRALLEQVDLARLLADDRLRIVAGPTPAEAEEALLEAWVPALAGALATRPLRPWCDLHREFFDPVAEGLSRAVDRAKADYAGQARFGRRWFANALANLAAIEGASLALDGVGAAIITGAGPTLDAGLDTLPAERSGRLLIATDTSLPALLARGIAPDLSLSIDCQPWSYHHYLAARAAEVPVLLDVSSPPVLGRTARRAGFVAGRHPLAGYISRHFRALPPVDTSGGNVSYAAVSVACSLGARTVSLRGVDLSYPLGSPYARGTWLHVVFRGREDRLHPAEGAFHSMLVSTPDTTAEHTPQGLRYVTPLMRDYRASLTRLAAAAGLECFPSDGSAAAGIVAPQRWEGGYAMGKPFVDRRGFLAGFARALTELPVPSRPLGRWFSGLSAGQLETWQVLLPIVPALRQDGDRASLLESARLWALQRVQGWLRVS